MKLAAFLVCLGMLAPEASSAAAQWTRRLDLQSAPFDHAGVPDAIVHAPPSFDSRAPLHLVVFFHGYQGCISVLAESGSVRCRAEDAPRPGWDLLSRHDAADTNTLFVVVQLALLRRDGSPGRFARHGQFRAFLAELLAALNAELGPKQVQEIASLTLLAHSAAFETSLAVLRAGGIEDLETHLVLLDALYSGGPAFLNWSLGARGRRLISIHGGHGTTRERNEDLFRRARRALGENAVRGTDPGELRGARVAIIETTTAHAAIPSVHIPAVLRALGLPQRGAAR